MIEIDQKRVELAKNWIETFGCESYKIFNVASSYGIKHWLEKSIDYFEDNYLFDNNHLIRDPEPVHFNGFYLTNDEFIQAMEEIGYVPIYELDGESVNNPYFKIDLSFYFEALGHNDVINDQVFPMSDLRDITEHNVPLDCCIGCGKTSEHFIEIPIKKHGENGRPTLDFHFACDPDHGSYFKGIFNSLLILKLKNNNIFTNGGAKI